MNTTLKNRLFEKCREFTGRKITLAQQAMDEAQAAANDETKSSAGDKYETGRAMMHLEKEKYARQLADGLALKASLEQIDVSKTYEKVQPGCLVKTNKGSYFIAIGAGKMEVDGASYFAVSPNSPIGQALSNLQAGNTLDFMGIQHTILEIH